MLQKIDGWLFDKVFQPFTNWFIDRTDRGPYWLAASCAYLYIASAISKIAIFPHSFLEAVEVSLFCGLAMYVAQVCDKNDKWDTQKTNLVANASRIDPFYFFMRISGVVVCILLVSDLFRPQNDLIERVVRLLQQAIFVCVFYFRSCETKPPAPPKRQPEQKLVYAN